VRQAGVNRDAAASLGWPQLEGPLTAIDVH